MIHRIHSKSPDETREMGCKLGAICLPGDWIGLTGELGAGKTCLTQGIALGLGVDPSIPVVSPTFVIHQIYPGRIPLHHLDLYRLQQIEELFEIGYQEILEEGGACVVEWCERIAGANPGRGVVIQVSLVDESTRLLVLNGIDKRGKELVRKLKAAV